LKSETETSIVEEPVVVESENAEESKEIKVEESTVEKTEQPDDSAVVSTQIGSFRALFLNL
jgi:hypothetical protein